MSKLEAHDSDHEKKWAAMLADLSSSEDTAADKAFTEIYILEFPALYRIASFRFSKPKKTFDVDDLVQQALIELWTRRRKTVFPNHQCLRGWLIKVLNHKAIDAGRKAGRERTKLTELGAILEEFVANEEIMILENRERFQIAFEQLSDDEQDMVIYRLASISFEEIARILGISVSAARMRFHRAMTKLKGLLPPDDLASEEDGPK